MLGAPLETVNKIFRIEDIEEILGELQRSYDALRREAEEERVKNEKFKYEYQERNLGNFNGYLKYTMEFADGTRTGFDNYRDVKNMLMTRLRTIVRIYAYYSVSFSVKAVESTGAKLITEHVNVIVDEDELKIETLLASENSRLTEVYKVIEMKVNAAPEKYDRLIKKKEFISWKIGVADGLVVLAVVLVGLIALSMVLPAMRTAVLGVFWAVPVAVIGLGLVLGILLGSARTMRIYNILIPNKKYVGYDTNTHQSVYNDDIVKFKETSDVLIGKKVDNLHLRERLMEMEQRARKRLWIEIAVIGALMVVWLVICLMMTH